MTETEAAVVAAAKQWLAAKEAMLISDETRLGDPPNNPPISTAVQVAGLLLGARIEIDAVAFIPKG